MKPEAKFNTLLRSLLPGMVVRVENGAEPGMPDIMVLYHGQVCFIESKVDQPLLRPLQYSWMVRANMQGYDCHVLMEKGNKIHAWTFPFLVKSVSRHVRIIDAPDVVLEKKSNFLKKFLRMP